MIRVLGALLLFAAGAAFAQTPPPWQIDRSESSIRFLAVQAGAQFEGGFDAFEAEIRFDPEDLEHSSARVEIRADSIDTQNGDRDEVLRSSEWFDPSRWPHAVFRTTAFRRADEGGYEALGDLTIRGISKSVVLPFHLGRLEDGRETIEGRLTIRRLEFGLGEGDWADTTWVGDPVTVVVRVVRAADTGD